MDTNKINILRKVAALGAVVVLFLAIYLGSYLPFQKASLFIKTARSLSTVTNLEDLKIRLDRVFDFYSPVGEEEVLRFFTSELGKAIGGETPQQVADFVIRYLENRYLDLVDRRPNLNLNKEIFQLAGLRISYGYLYKDGTSLALAEQYYLEGLRLSPRRPEFLFGLYDLYRNTARTEDAARIGQEILTYWPSLPINLPTLP